MWNPALVVNGQASFLGDDMGRMAKTSGWTWTSSGVTVRRWYMGHGGSMREGLAVCPGWGRGEAQGNHSTRGPRGPLPTVQLLLILNSWHIIGMQALAVFRWEAEISGRPPSRARVQCGCQRSTLRG